MTSSFVLKDDCYPKATYLKAMGLRLRIRVLTNPVLGISRESQSVTLPKGKRAHYDFLVIATGLQDSCAPRLATIDYQVGWPR